MKIDCKVPKRVKNECDFEIKRIKELSEAIHASVSVDNLDLYLLRRWCEELNNRLKKVSILKERDDIEDEMFVMMEESLNYNDLLTRYYEISGLSIKESRRYVNYLFEKYAN